MRWKRLILIATCLVALSGVFTWLAEAAWGRVGGGQTYSGRSYSSSRSSSYGGSWGRRRSNDFYFFYLLIQYPWLIIPVFGLIFLYSWAKSQSQEQEQLSFLREGDRYQLPPEAAANSNDAMRFTRRRQALQLLQNQDRNFSEPIFLDFVSGLYVRLQEGRFRGFPGVSHYLSREVANQLQGTEANSRAKITDVVVGNITIAEAHLNSLKKLLQITVQVESNYTLQKEGVPPQRLYSLDLLTLSRRQGVLSQGPVQMSTFACPHCGGTSGVDPQTGTCLNCHEPVLDGRFSWVVTTFKPHSEPNPPLTPSSHDSTSAKLPIKRSLTFAANYRRFMGRYPQFDWKAFGERVKNAFLQMQKAWSDDNWESIRSLETDYLFSTHSFWMDRYRRQGLRNKMEDVQVLQLEVCAISSDAFYDIVTVYLKAKAKDYTINLESGQIVAGSNRKEVEFAEYWTFIRTHDFQESQHQDETCPHCGAPLKVAMSGICPYCDTKITLGTFDWTLSNIQQTESYTPI